MSEPKIALGYSPSTAASAAFFPPISENAIRMALREGSLKSYRVKQSRVILADDLVAWVRSHPQHTGRKTNGPDLAQ